MLIYGVNYMPLKNINYKTLCANISRDINFTFSRFGDGEWICIFKALGWGKNNAKCNTDHHVYFKDMGLKLASIIKSDPKYYFGMQPLAMNLMQGLITKFIKGTHLNIIEGDIFHTASIKGQLKMFFDSLDNRNVKIIGNSTMLKLAKINARLVTIPLNNCWQAYAETKKVLFSTIKPNDVLLYCASMMSEVLIDDMWNRFNNTITQVDCGSLFDPYVGRKTRIYHKKLRLI